MPRSDDTPAKSRSPEPPTPYHRPTTNRLAKKESHYTTRMEEDNDAEHDILGYTPLDFGETQLPQILDPADTDDDRNVPPTTTGSDSEEDQDFESVRSETPKRAEPPMEPGTAATSMPHLAEPISPSQPSADTSASTTLETTTVQSSNGEITITPSTTSETNPIDPPTLETTTDDTQERIPLVELLKEHSKIAQEDNGFGRFFMIPAPFESLKIDSTPEAIKKASTRDSVQWTRIDNDTLDEKLKHFSVNSLDFMPDRMITECFKAGSEKPNKLAELNRIAIVELGFKILAKVLCEERNGDQEKNQRKAEWITHAIRSLLATSGVPLDSALATLSFDKNSYDWQLVSLTKEALDILTSVRAAYDPRAHILVLFRQWNTIPPKTQFFRISGIITEADANNEAKEEAKEAFKEQFETALRPYNVLISKMVDAPETRAGKPVHCVNTYFSFSDGSPTFQFKPKQIPSTFNGPDGQRKLEVDWPKTCHYCLSETHEASKPKQQRCPWFEHMAKNEKTLSAVNYFRFIPGQTDKSLKRKRSDQNENTTPIDIRPPIRPPKRRKEEKTDNTSAAEKEIEKEKEKEKATDNQEAMETN